MAVRKYLVQRKALLLRQRVETREKEQLIQKALTTAVMMVVKREPSWARLTERC